MALPTGEPYLPEDWSPPAALKLRGDDAGEAGDQSGDRAAGDLQERAVESVEAIVDPVQLRIDLVEASVDFLESPVDLIETMVDVPGEIIQPLVGPAVSHVLHGRRPYDNTLRRWCAEAKSLPSAL